MKRLHVHVSVEDLAESTRFYSAMFGAGPTVAKPDYAKWMLDDPRVNFAISARGRAPGLDHLGLQVETPDELSEVYARLQKAGRPVLEEGETTCCYARSEKAWTADPQGILWESFLTTGESTVYGDDVALDAANGKSACCGPTTPQGVCCPPKPEIAADSPCCGPKG